MTSATSYDLDYYREEYGEGTDPWTEMSWLDRRTEQWLDEWEVPLGDQTALDLGCGRGRITRLLAQRGIRTIGIDYLQEVLSPNRSPDQPRYVRGDALVLPFTPGSFSLVVDYGFLHHVRKSDQQTYRDNLTNVLKPGSRLFLSVFHRLDEHANNDRRPWVYHRGHYDRFFTQGSLDRALGPRFSRLEAERIEQDDTHVFLHACYEFGG